MKMKRQLFLFVTGFLVLSLAACGAPATRTPTAAVPTDVPSETSTVEMTVTETVTETETPTPTATVETSTPTATVQAGIVPIDLICWFCIQQVPHVMVSLPASATFEVLASSAGVECNSVETVDDMQVVLCQGPKQAGNVSFDLQVCSNGNCSDRHLATVDCAATAMPTNILSLTTTITPTVTTTGTLGLMTQTPTTEAGATVTITTTPVMDVTVTSTVEGTTSTPLPTATPTP